VYPTASPFVGLAAYFLDEFEEICWMETKLYVGNLSYQTTELDLRNLFTQAGAITSVSLITDRETGRSKGFAFIEMASQSEAEAAIKMFNGSRLGDREINVNIARPREERPTSGYGSRPGGYNNKGGDRNRSRTGGKRRY
jgi:RNA recognition motif-containing protein